MFNFNARMTQVVLILILVYLVFGDCTLLKLLALALGGFLVYKNYIPAKNPTCRSNDCIVAPLDAVVSDLYYEGDDAVIELEPKWYMPSVVFMPQNGPLQIKKWDGAVLGSQDPLAEKLNGGVVFAGNNARLQLHPSYVAAKAYASSGDSYFTGDIIGRLLLGRATLRISGASAKVGRGDVIKAKETLVAYIDEHQV
jgi:hypothetical protein